MVIDDLVAIKTPALEGKVARMQLAILDCINSGRHCGTFGKFQYCMYHLTEELNPPVRCKYLIDTLVYVKKGKGVMKINMPYYGCVRPRTVREGDDMPLKQRKI
jgi:hypothetical protein